MPSSILLPKKEGINMKLTKEELDNELLFLISDEILMKMLQKGLIDEGEYQSSKDALLSRYKPIISSLLGD